MKKIRILHVNNMLEIGGTSYLVRLTSALDKSLFENHIAYCGDDFYLSRLDSGVKAYKYSNRKAGIRSIDTLTAPLKLARFIKKNKIDIVHTYMLPSNLWGLAAGRLASVPTVNTIVESLLLGQRFSKLCFKHPFVARGFDALVTRYNALARYSISEYAQHLGVDPSKIVFTGHGVDVEKFCPNEAYSRQIRKEFNIGSDTRVLASVARLAAEKGIDRFLDLIPRIKNEFSNFKFFMVGDGRIRKDLEEKSRRLGIEDVTVFTGPRYDTDKLFNAIDCHLFTGPRPLLGNANMEAMACGKPVIVYAPDAIDFEIAKELIDEGVNGFIPKDEDGMADSVLKILKDPHLAAGMGINARRTVQERFDFKQHVLNMQEFYLGLADGISNVRKDAVFPAGHAVSG